MHYPLPLVVRSSPEAQGIGPETLREALLETDFCLICGDPLIPGSSLRCPEHQSTCLDPDCHSSAPDRDHRSLPTRRETAKLHQHDSLEGILVESSSGHGLWTDLNGVELYCQCCTEGCDNHTDPSEAWSIIKHFTLDQKKGNRKSLVYRYRDDQKTTFGMTYSPDQRTRQRVAAQAVYQSLADGFLSCLDRLDWLSSLFDDRLWSFFLECYIKRLRTVSKLPKADSTGQRKSRNLYNRLLAANGLFDLEHKGQPSNFLPKPSWSPADRLVGYKLSFIPRDVSMDCVYAAVYNRFRFRRRLSFSGRFAPPVNLEISRLPSGRATICLTLPVPLQQVFDGFETDLVFNGPGGANRLVSVSSLPYSARLVEVKRNSRGRLDRVSWTSPRLPPKWGLVLQFSLSILTPDGRLINRSPWSGERFASVRLPDGDATPAVNLALNARVLPSVGDATESVASLALWDSLRPVPVAVYPKKTFLTRF